MDLVFFWSLRARTVSRMGDEAVTGVTKRRRKREMRWEKGEIEEQ